jgi:predicted nucleic acid-binding protein
MAGFVLDASIALAAILPGESGASVATSVISDIPSEPAIVPQIWRAEVGNACVMAGRRGRLPAEQVPRALERLRGLPVSVDHELGDAAWEHAIRLALEHRLTLYDAVYLELAIRLTVPLATFDAALRRAAEAEGVPLANPLA